MKISGNFVFPEGVKSKTVTIDPASGLITHVEKNNSADCDEVFDQDCLIFPGFIDLLARLLPESRILDPAQTNLRGFDSRPDSLLQVSFWL